jgi:hypothetical protein
MNRTELPITRPCQADWNTMTLADRGRFCGECKKVVRELAQMTESEARAVLAAPPTEGLCVRYIHDATGEIIFRPEGVPLVPLSRLRRVRYAAATALAAATLPLAAAGCMGAAPMPPPVMGAAPMPSASAPPEPTTQVMMGAPPVAVVDASAR